MSQGVILSICKERTKLVEELEHWRIDHEHAMFAWDVQAMVWESLQFAEFVDECSKVLWKGLSENALEDIHLTGVILKRAFVALVRLIEHVKGLVRDASALGHHIESADRLDDALSQARAAEAHLEQWPWFDEAAFKESGEAFARGDSKSARLILDELRRSGS